VEGIQERARELGRLVAQTEEYKALKRANERLGEDRESITLMNRLAELEEEMTTSLRTGREPGAEAQEEFTKLAEQIQQRSVYQTVVAAQSNFERLMGRINEEIGRGIETGEQSRIILP
jgi:cell fate (sporulation/competence/biofilm development) regulator YlbF (YheA/YmcA/DUF963 family)